MAIDPVFIQEKIKKKEYWDYSSARPKNPLSSFVYVQSTLAATGGASKNATRHRRRPVPSILIINAWLVGWPVPKKKDHPP